MGRPTTARARPRHGDDAGFTLVEVIVAMMVFATIATALGYTAMGALRASNTSRAEQQAIDFATQKLEALRAIDYASLGHNLAVDTAADPRIKSCTAPRDTSRKCATWTDPTSGAINEEYLVTGTLASHSEVANDQLSNSSTYTISYYVTQPAEASVNYLGAGLDFKRVTVVSSWKNGSTQRERATSSLVTLTTRGLPVPTFKLIPQNDNCTVTIGASCVYEIELTNQGAPDAFDLSVSDTGRTWAYYRDAPDGTTPANGVFGQEDVLMPSGRTTTLGPTQSLTIFAVVTFAATGSYGPFALTARSVLQPSSTSATERIPNLTATVNANSTQTLPGQPGTPVITPQSGSMGVSWTAPASVGNPTIDYYQVEIRRTDQAWTSATIATVSYPTTSHTFSGLTNGIVYDVRVVAHNTLGLGSYSATSSAAPINVVANRPPGAPGTPVAAPTADGLGSYQLAVSWAAPADLGLPNATSYRLEYKLQAASWPTTADKKITVTIPAATATITGLPASTSFELRVFAVNTQGDSPASISTFITTPTPTGVETRCATQYSSTPFDAFSLVSGLSKKSYSLTNKGSQWPADPTTPDTSTVLQKGLTMSEANPGSLHLAGTTLPRYSMDLSTSTRGRIIERSSWSQSSAVSATDYPKFVDWAVDVKESRYDGSGVLSLWIARADPDTTATLTLQATLYAYQKSGSGYSRVAVGSPASVTIPAGLGTPCAGTDTWAPVRLQLPLGAAVHLNNSGEYLGVRIWNTGSKDLRVAYGVIGDYPAALEISGGK